MSQKPPKFQRRRKGKRQLESAVDVLQGLLQNGKSPISDQFLRWKLWNSWAEVVGPTIAKNCEPVGYNHRILYIWAKSSVWMQQLVFMSVPIRDKVNEYVGSNWVRQVRFTLDHKLVSELGEAKKDLKEFLSNVLPNEGGKPPRDR